MYFPFDFSGSICYNTANMLKLDYPTKLIIEYHPGNPVTARVRALKTSVKLYFRSATLVEVLELIARHYGYIDWEHLETKGYTKFELRKTRHPMGNS